MKLIKLCFLLLFFLSCIGLSIYSIIFNITYALQHNVISMSSYEKPISCMQDCCEIHCKQHLSYYNSCIQACNTGLSVFNKKDKTQFTNCKNLCKQI